MAHRPFSLLTSTVVWGWADRSEAASASPLGVSRTTRQRWSPLAARELATCLPMRPVAPVRTTVR